MVELESNQLELWLVAVESLLVHTMVHVLVGKMDLIWEVNMIEQMVECLAAVMESMMLAEWQAQELGWNKGCQLAEESDIE